MITNRNLKSMESKCLHLPSLQVNVLTFSTIKRGSLLGFVSTNFAHLKTDFCLFFIAKKLKFSQIGWRASVKTNSYNKYSIGFRIFFFFCF